MSLRESIFHSKSPTNDLRGSGTCSFEKQSEVLPHILCNAVLMWQQQDPDKKIKHKNHSLFHDILS